VPNNQEILRQSLNMTLEKDRKVRYQSAADIRTDLLRLKRDNYLTTMAAR
jgi:hypothetical protein